MKFLVSQSNARLQVLRASVGEMGYIRLWGALSGRGNKHFSLPKPSKLVLGSSQPPTPKVMGALPWGKAAGGVRQTSHLQLVPRLGRSGAVPLLLPIPFAYMKRQNFLDCNVCAAQNISALSTVQNKHKPIFSYR
jgi:hypothetical protein